MKQIDHAQNDLQLLWDVIRGHKTRETGRIVGLMAVEFAPSLDVFSARYGLAVREDYERVTPKVTTDLGEAVRILSGKRIVTHHLSCAANRGSENNTALCVHYKNPSGFGIYTVAIPGVNYKKKSRIEQCLFTNSLSPNPKPKKLYILQQLRLNK